MRWRHVAWGLAAVAAYLAAVEVSLWIGLVPARPLLDGLAPPLRYRWIAPPPELREGNLAPEPGVGRLLLREDASGQVSVATQDGQAVVIFPVDAVAPRPEQVEVKVAITPMNPAKLPPPPVGMTIEGNAYRIDATYQPSGEPATLARSAGLVLRYPIDATALLVIGNGGWREIESSVASATLSIHAEISAMGTFAAAAPERSRRSPPSTPAWTYLAAGAALAAAVALSLGGKGRVRPKAGARE